MNRRGFLQAVAGVGVALTAGELLLPKRTIFLPPRGGWPHAFEDGTYGAWDVGVDRIDLSEASLEDAFIEMHEFWRRGIQLSVLPNGLIVGIERTPTPYVRAHEGIAVATPWKS